MNRIWTIGAAVAALFLAPAIGRGATLSFSGTFVYDADLAFMPLVLNSDSVISVQSYGYGGSNTLTVAPGGFAGSLALYNSAGLQVASDIPGGTAVGAGCSHAGSQDPVTGFCEDPSLSTFQLAGNYILAMSVQGNDVPLFLADGYSLLPGTNLGSVAFLDPGDLTGQTVRNGNWFLQVNLDGGTQVPEPASLLLSAVGLTALLAIRRTR